MRSVTRPPPCPTACRPAVGGRAFWAGVALLIAGCSAAAADVQVAVAANFAAPMKAIAADFERSTGHRAVLSFGASGRFYAQIVAGAPFEVLLSADAQVPERLVAQGLALADTRRTYALGRLVLWSADAGRIDDQARVLRNPQVRRLALANPKLAPYGHAAQQALRALGLESAWQGRLVMGESIAQAHQFVATGNAEIGFVAWSQVMDEGGRPVAGSAWPVPETLHAPIRQDLVLLAAGRVNPAAQALLDHLRSPSAQAAIVRHGYRLPPP